MACIIVAVLFVLIGYVTGRVARDLQHAQQIVGYETTITSLRIEMARMITAMNERGIPHLSPIPPIPRQRRTEGNHTNKDT